VFEPFALAVEGMDSDRSLLDSVKAECLDRVPPPDLGWRAIAGPVAAERP
jgi:hypothetical protein